ncbi:MAG: hypothetical protein IT439_00915 [Phycisphaerales bacterium]|nr:hypothetical protein [Phycisphaerales bacterium]
MKTRPDEEFGARASGGGQATAEPAPVDITERVLRLCRNAAVVGITVSLAVHLIGWIISMMVGISLPGKAAAVEPVQGIEFAVMMDAELKEIEDAALTQLDPSVPEVALENVVSDELLDAPAVSDETGAVIDEADLGDIAGGGDIGSGPGIGEGSGGSGGGASLFGVEASGRRFAFIIDVSGSMAYEGKIEALRAQLASSLEGLVENAEFCVMLFSNGAFPLGGRAGWIEANPREKARARQSISALTPSGGTFPEEAFVEVFKLKPAPDAIYFLTDGEFDPAVVTTVNSINKSPTIPIHCISFVNPVAGAAMKQIAQASGGTYTHVPGPGRP